MARRRQLNLFYARFPALAGRIFTTDVGSTAVAPVLHQDMTLAVGLVVIVDTAELRAGATGLTRWSGAACVRVAVIALTDRYGVKLHLVSIKPILLDNAHAIAPNMIARYSCASGVSFHLLPPRIRQILVR